VWSKLQVFDMAHNNSPVKNAVAARRGMNG
jgi:hypothetical protein